MKKWKTTQNKLIWKQLTKDPLIDFNGFFLYLLKITFNFIGEKTNGITL